MGNLPQLCFVRLRYSRLTVIRALDVSSRKGIDGHFFQVRSDGSVREVDDSVLSPFAAITAFSSGPPTRQLYVSSRTSRSSSFAKAQKIMPEDRFAVADARRAQQGELSAEEGYGRIKTDVCRHKAQLSNVRGECRSFAGVGTPKTLLIRGTASSPEGKR
jgi:Alpha-acetolactate decarboxylase